MDTNSNFTIKKVGILGHGEIGKAIHQFYKRTKFKVFIKDIDKDNLPEDLDLLHVCIPFNSKFTTTVMETIQSNCRDGLVIIHSTVDIGTTSLLTAYYPYIVHSPCSGVHPNLYEGLKTFTKFIGTNAANLGKIASDHLNELGMKTSIIFDSRNTEAMKLWDTTYYFWNLAFQKELHRFCQKHKLNFDHVYTSWNTVYNKGYKKLKRNDVVRPVLKFVEGKIGGHCLVPNAEILSKYRSFIPKLLVNKNKTY